MNDSFFELVNYKSTIDIDTLISDLQIRTEIRGKNNWRSTLFDIVDLVYNF